MMKWLNIIVIVYLAAAPAMDVGRLIHAVNLCRFADPAGHTQAVQHEHQCPHHAPKPEKEPQDCPHVHSVAVHATAMPALQLQPVTQAGLPILNPPLVIMLMPGGACSVANDTPRPPPGPPLVGITILLV